MKRRELPDIHSGVFLEVDAEELKSVNRSKDNKLRLLIDALLQTNLHLGSLPVFRNTVNGHIHLEIIVLPLKLDD